MGPVVTDDTFEEACKKADQKAATKLQPELAQILDGVHAFLGRFVIYPSKEACVVHGQQVLTEDIPAFCAVALAGLGWLKPRYPPAG